MTDDLSPARAALVRGAHHVATMLADPAVAAAWSTPSALATWPVSTLAGHLASQVLNPRQKLQPRGVDPDRPAIPLVQHYQQVAWIGADPETGPNVGIRAFSDDFAAPGPTALAAQVQAEVPLLEQWLRAAPADAVVDPPWNGWAVTLDSFATTRLVEISFHADDLAVSLGLPTTTPDEVTAPVLALLVQLSAARHGASAVLRTFGRTERAPATIATF
ncbi:MAG: maleylpyruvate isomerase N-terminal domain-containing protein [Mycobacteriales bacterium]